MLHHDARPNLDSNTQQRDAAPPARDRMPTLPYDLSEYAWLHTGPASWTAEHIAAAEGTDDDSAGDDDWAAERIATQATDADDEPHGPRLVTAHLALRAPLHARRCVERIARAAGGSTAAGAPR